jgi:hypothetical protein
MEKLSLLLLFIGISVFVFSLWSLILIKRHLKAFNSGYRKDSSLRDAKYFELKSKQEYIIAVSAVILSIMSFIGYTSIENIKADIRSSVQTEVDRLSNLDKQATDTYSGLTIKGHSFVDSMRSAMNIVQSLTNRMKTISAKDVIRQNIFIVDPLRIGDFPIDKSDKFHEGNRIVKFADLRTVNGERLPTFKVKPSVICMATSRGTVVIEDVFVDRFVLNLQSYTPKDDKDKTDGDNITFVVWISQKPDKSFSDDFSSDFH